MQSRAIEYAMLFLIAFIVTVAAIPLVKRLAVKLDAVDYPSGRRVNKTPIPRLGGVAIFVGMFASLSLVFLLVNLGIWETPFVQHPVLKVDWTIAGFGVMVMFFVGVADDIYDLSPISKLLGQIASACFVASSGILLVSIGTPFISEHIELGWLSYPLTVVYLVAFANIINLIDGLDGLSSGITIISAIAITVFAVSDGRIDAVVLALALIGACAGFLCFNKHPASIFMGDSGALVLGEMLGIISLVAIARSSLFTSLLVPILAAGVPIIDTLFSIIRRKCNGQSILQADRGHIHHRLLDAGYSQEKAVYIMWGWTAILAAGGVAITAIHDWPRYLVFAVLVLMSGFAIYKLGLMKGVLEHRYNPRISRRHIKDGTFAQEEKDAFGEVKIHKGRKATFNDEESQPEIEDGQ